MPVSNSAHPVQVPAETLDWLLEPENPAVAVLTRRTLLGETDDAAAETSGHAATSTRRSPRFSRAARRRLVGRAVARLPEVRRIAVAGDFLGELWANGDDERVQRAADYAFSRQKPDGTWSANTKAAYDMPCLTANVGRGLARMGWARDERVVAACAHRRGLRRLGFSAARTCSLQLNGYCHMLTPKVLLFLGEVPTRAVAGGGRRAADACVEALRDKEVYRSPPGQFKEFQAEVWPLPAKERAGGRERFLAEHSPLTTARSRGGCASASRCRTTRTRSRRSRR